MKKSSSKIILLLPFIILLFISCGGKKNLISKDKLNGAVRIFEECMSDCDKMEARYMAEYVRCIDQCNDTVELAIEVCNRTFPPGSQQSKCKQDKRAEHEKCKLACFKVLETRQAEIRECRSVCIDRISILAR